MTFWHRPSRKLQGARLRPSRTSLARAFVPRRAGALTFLANFALFLLLSLAGGFASAWYGIEIGSRLTTERHGPWRSWIAAGRPDADPYTRAYMARSGRLPITSTSARYYLAREDSEGNALDERCEYVIEGRGPTGGWWSLAAYDADGRLMRNPAERYAFNSASLLRAPDGSWQIRLARDARAGNWLPVSGDNGLALMLRVYGSGVRGELSAAAQGGLDLPAVRRVRCD